MFYGFMNVSGSKFGCYTIFNATNVVVYSGVGTREEMEGRVRVLNDNR